MATSINGLTQKEQKHLEELEAKFEAAGGRGIELADEIDDLKARRDEPEKAAEVYEELLNLVDGGSGGLIEFAASTIMAMMDDHRYRAKVKKWHEQIYG